MPQRGLSGSGRVTGTGIWPMVNPRPWNMTAPPGYGVVVDSVAVASEAARELKSAGWPGIGLMDDAFQMSILEAPAHEIPRMVEGWFEANKDAVADLLDRRLADYGAARLSKSAVKAMGEALESYRQSRYLSAVRVLMPEIERIARTMVTDRTARTSQAVAIKKLRELLQESPLIKEEPLEAFSLYHFIDHQLFAACHTEADAAAFGGVPNRHAELHGFESYGDLRGASIMLCVMDLLLRMSSRLLDLGHEPPSGTAV